MGVGAPVSLPTQVRLPILSRLVILLTQGGNLPILSSLAADHLVPTRSGIFRILDNYRAE